MNLFEGEQVHVAGKSHPGMSGKNNEDRYAVTVYPISKDGSRPAVVAIISDGIGGHRAGEVAAEIAVETITRGVVEASPDRPTTILAEAIINAGRAIYQQSEVDSNQRGMGATVACAWIIENRLYTASVGDSRIYLIRNGMIQQTSIDHTWIQEALDNGLLTPEQARGHPNAHVIRRYLGSRQPVVPDLRLRLHEHESNAQAEANQGLELQIGDQVLLCSDGLTDLVDDHEILHALYNYTQEEALEALIGLANERGGHDNITIVSLQMLQSEFAPAAPTMPIPVVQKARGTKFRWACLTMAFAMFTGLATLGSLYWYLNRPGAVATPTPVIITIASPLPTAITTSPSSQTSPIPASPTRPAALSPAPTILRATLTPWPTNTPLAP